MRGLAGFGNTVAASDSIGVRPFALDQPVHPRGTTERRFGLLQPQLRVGGRDVLVVREQARVPVGGVQQRETHVAAVQVDHPAVVAVGCRSAAGDRKGCGKKRHDRGSKSDGLHGVFALPKVPERAPGP